MTGRLLHPYAVHDVRATIPSIYKSVLFLNAIDHVAAEELSTFTIAWQYRAFDLSGHPLDVLSEPVVLNDIVYVLLSDATLRALEMKTGREIGMWYGKGAVDRRSIQTPFIADLEIGKGFLIATFGTNELCAFE